MRSAGTDVMGAIFNLNKPAHVVEWHFIQLSVANLIVIALMLVVFALAIALPFPGARGRALARRTEAAPNDTAQTPEPTAPHTTKPTWTGRVREAAVAALPPEKLLPDSQPTYVASWIYVFGVASIAALAVIIGSGTILR